MYRKHICLTPLLFTVFLAMSWFIIHGAVAMPQAAPPSTLPVASGTVVETMDASGYTYMLVDNGTVQSWVAIPAATVEKGTVVKYYQGMEMKDFTSKTLNRTFDSVIFSSGLADTPSDENAQPAIPAEDDSFAAAVKAEKSVASAAPPMAGSGGSSGAVVPLEEIAIKKSPAANGYSVEEIFAKAAELNGQKVQIQAKVVKFSPLIMGKNWIHLQDGTGDPMANSHDLVATTSETVEVGQVVVVEGVLAADKDFGAGYKYAAIIEDAVVVK